MPQLTIVEAREQLAELLNRVAYGKERIVLTRCGKALVGIVPLEDLRWLEGLTRDEERSTSEAAEVRR
jgi:prevent-host-death family protein